LNRGFSASGSIIAAGRNHDTAPEVLLSPRFSWFCLLSPFFVTSEPDLERVYVGGELLVEKGKLLKHDFAKIQAEVDGA
jgi:hypothetical protein